ncbi:MAG: UDP-N-acetylmuramoyl-L-alanine--D-glutamate ligase, partial [Clostridia bacterium]|nr:UDP-N-acetylmuramoyl-L-alanine--D-glutamate ligase [Clostridia bacterium]
MSDIVIYGAGKTGMALKSLLQHNDVAIYDDVPSKCSGVVDWEKVKLVITSPGIAPTSKFVAQCRQRGVKVVGELQFCYWLCNNPIVSVTGTNGKTTVTQLIKHMMEACNKKCSLLGNGGTPFSQNIAHLEDDTIVVLESSSFQLDDCVDFAPNVSAFTNLAPDHLDYHQSYANYVEAKCNNFVHQKDNQWAIFNMDDANVVELSTKCKAGKLYFSTIKPCNCYYKDGYVIVDFQGTMQKVKFESSYSQHNLSNVLCAALCVAALGLDVKQALQNIADFKFDKHRLQFVASVNGVRFVDDSKATNLHAVISALHSIEGKACLILG